MINLDLDESLVINDIPENEIKIYITKIVEEALKLNNITNKNIYLSIQSVSKEEIKKINKEYRNVDSETDVLSFPIFEKDEFKNLKFDEVEIGDIIICLDVVKSQAIEYGTGQKRELLYMITHGVCHLLRI
ncbi:MAG: rRNA maturation RNase YbeY [Clostridia bacterium]